MILDPASQRALVGVGPALFSAWRSQGTIEAWKFFACINTCIWTPQGQSSNSVTTDQTDWVPHTSRSP